MTSHVSDPPARLDWAGDDARRWAAVADQVEAQLAPVSDVLFAAAALQPGERVLDVGCGRGATTRQAAELVGPDGAATGLDVSSVLLDEAATFTSSGAPIEWLLADAQRAELPVGRFDAVISRFGVMFFDDGVEAFANLARTSAPGGRLCVAVWQHRDRSEVFRRPMEVAVRIAEAAGAPIVTMDPTTGPFAYGDPEVARATLASAGWHDVEITPHELAMYAGGPGSVEAAVDVALSIGTMRATLAEAPPEVIDAVRIALLDDLTPAHDGTGVKLDGAIAIVTATAPATVGR